MSQQSQPKEDSVMFSLRSLMAIEDDRLRQEDNVRRSAVAAETARLEAARQREVDEAQARVRAEADARTAQERQRREADAQLAREREESALRIRLDAELKRRERELSLRMEQEQKLAILATQQRRGMHPGAVALGVFALVGVLGAGAFFGVLKPQQRASAAATLRAETARRHADDLRMTAERDADDARRSVAESEAAHRRQVADADALRAAQNAARVTPPVAVRPPSPPRRNPPSTRSPELPPEIIGIDEDTIPGADRH